MTNWPNIQEYRHLEAKFFDNPKYNNSAEGNDLESVIKIKYDSDDPNNSLKGSESKIVRCVIRKDFEENYKKFDRGDGLALNNNINECVRNKLQEPTRFDQSTVDKIRLENHLKWKKQKEMEYLQKKEAERIAQQKKKEEELRAEKNKKMKEKERAEKIREWQEQKAKEKEGKKREKMEMKVLEDELKEITPVINKEKLIEEWVKLKDKQRQLEAEKKAEILRKEEESKALRQNLAALSYRQWKERLKGKMMSLPKNGYQIFGPKPVPVVKEDWNHNFTSNSPRPSQNLNLRVTKSNITTNPPSLKEFENFPALYLKDLGRKSPSFYDLKKVKSGINVYDSDEFQKDAQCGMPLKELQPGAIGLNKNSLNKLAENYKKFGLFPTNINPMTILNSVAKIKEKDVKSDKLNITNKFSTDFLPSLMYSVLSENEGSRGKVCTSNSYPKQSDKPAEVRNIPTKTKIDLYINTSTPEEETAENSPKISSKKPPGTTKNLTFKIRKENKKKETETKKNVGISRKKTKSKEKCPTQGLDQSFASKAASEAKITTKNSQVKEKGTKKVFYARINSASINRTSRSYDRPVKKNSKERHKAKGCTSSRSAKKNMVNRDHVPKMKIFQKKRKNLKQPKLSCSAGSAKNVKTVKEADGKVKRKIKTKNSLPSKSFSFTDSPYYARKPASTAPQKSKSIHRKKGGEAKSDDAAAGRCRKSSTTKI